MYGVGGQVPPVGVLADQVEHSRSDAAEHDRDRLAGRRQLCVLTIGRPVLLECNQGFAEGGDPFARRCGTQFELGELVGHRAGSEAEFEPATGGLGERHGLLGQHRGVPERVAQHQVANLEPLGPRRYPGRDGHGLPDRAGRRHRRFEVVEEGDAVEARRLRGLRARHQVVDALSALRNVQKPFRHALPLPILMRANDNGILHY
jgi:hypothetical protein